MEKFKVTERVPYGTLSQEDSEQKFKHMAAAKLAEYIFSNYADRIRITPTEHGVDYELELVVFSYFELVTHCEDYCRNRIKELINSLNVEE
jgi:hypothetical protein